MKKIIALFVVCLLTLSLMAACGTPAPAEPAAPAAPAEPAAPAPAAPAEPAPAGGGTVGVTLYARDQFISNLEQGILKAGEAYSDYKIDSQEANNDTQKQAEQVRTFKTMGYSAMIVNLVDTATAETIMAEAGDTPIIFINRRPVDELLKAGKYAYVGSQETDAGNMQAEFLAGFFKDKADKTLKYVLFMGQLGLENTNARTSSVKEGLEKAGFTLTKVFEDTAEWDRAKAMDKMQTIIGTGEAFDVVICNNDEMALGAIEAMKAAGLDLSKIPVVGIDATASACEAVKNGEMAATVFQDANGQGALAMELAVKAAKGESFDIFGWVPFKPVTKANVADFM